MAFWDKVKSMFGASDRRPKNSLSTFQPQRRPPKRNHGNPSTCDSDDDKDLCGALSEVAAPEPVQRLSPEEQTRRPSLEQRLSDMSNSGHKREDDIYENLSELAAPEPIERLSESEMEKRPSLERNISRYH